MNKQELIEMMVVDLNGDFDNPVVPLRYFMMTNNETAKRESVGFAFTDAMATREEFNAAADRLRGKPDWKDAPVWAQWLAQDSYGDWYWYPRQENPPMQSTVGFVNKSAHRCKNACSGKVIGDWRNTLEKRPQQNAEPAPAKPWFEAGELPPVGSTEIDCKIKGKAYEQIKAFKVLAHENGKAVIASYHNEREHWAEIESYHKRPVNFTPYVISKPYFLPIEPIKTGKEKAIEAAIDVLVEFPSAVAHVGWIGKLYDAGLLRLPDQK